MQGLTALRIVNKPDIVPDVPRAFYLQNVYYALGALLNQGDTIGAAVNTVESWGHALRFPTCYHHVGAEIAVDSRQVKWIRKMEGERTPDRRHRYRIELWGGFGLRGRRKERGFPGNDPRVFSSAFAHLTCHLML